MSRPPIAYEITKETYDAALLKLNTVPRDQWPSPEMFDRVLIGVRLYQMETAELE